MAFNEDWIGNGGPRWPLESNSLLAAWNEVPVRYVDPPAPAGGFMTRDANRTAVKLRTFGFLSRLRPMGQDRSSLWRSLLRRGLQECPFPVLRR